MNTIHVLPVIDPNTSNFVKAFMENIKVAATLDYSPDSLETLKSIDYSDRKLLMAYNKNFYATAIKLCDGIIDTMIRDIKRHSRRKCLKGVSNLEDLLNCGYYFDDYESSRREFVTVLCEDYLTG